MKKIFKNLLLSTLTLTLIVSCEDNSEPSFVLTPVEGYLETSITSITNLDQNFDIEMNYEPLLTSSIDKVDIFKVTIETGEPKTSDLVGQATINENVVSFNTSILSPFFNSEDTGTMLLETLTTLTNGETLTNGFSIDVTKASDLSIEDNESNVVENFPFQSPEEINVIMKNTSLSSPNAVETLEWKKFDRGTYTADTFVFNNSTDDTLELSGANSIFNRYGAVIGDTIYLKYTLNNGSDIDSTVKKIAIQSQFMGDTQTVVMGNDDTMELNLSAPDSTTPEIVYEAPTTIKASATSSIEFVKSTLSYADSDQLFESGDLFKAMEQFDSGTTITELNSIEGRDFYFYKITRETAPGEITDYFGILKIDSIVDSGANYEKINISFKEGKFL